MEKKLQAARSAQHLTSWKLGGTTVYPGTFTPTPSGPRILARTAQEERRHSEQSPTDVRDMTRSQTQTVKQGQWDSMSYPIIKRDSMNNPIIKRDSMSNPIIKGETPVENTPSQSTSQRRAGTRVQTKARPGCLLSCISLHSLSSTCLLLMVNVV